VCYSFIEISQEEFHVKSKFIKKFKTGVKNLAIEKVIAFDKHLRYLFSVFIFCLQK